MKQTITFNLPDDNEEYQQALNVGGYFGVMMPVISVKPCHLKDHTII